MKFYNLWSHNNTFENCHIAGFNISWQFDGYYKCIRIILFNFAVEIGV